MLRMKSEAINLLIKPSVWKHFSIHRVRVEKLREEIESSRVSDRPCCSHNYSARSYFLIRRKY